jgi:hypothetical protein
MDIGMYYLVATELQSNTFIPRVKQFFGENITFLYCGFCERTAPRPIIRVGLCKTRKRNAFNP